MGSSKKYMGKGSTERKLAGHGHLQTSSFKTSSFKTGVKNVGLALVAPISPAPKRAPIQRGYSTLDHVH